jgi:hypothetical protein
VASGERSGRASDSALRLDRTRSGDRVELICVVEDGCLGRSRRPRVVMSGDDVEQLGGHVRIEPARPFLDEPEAEVHVAEEAAFRGREKERAAVQLPHPARVVEQRPGEEQVAAQAGMELRRLATERSDADRVLEEPTGIRVVAADRRGQRPQPAAEPFVGDESRDEGSEAGMPDLASEKLEKPVELVEVAAGLRRQVGRIGVRRLEGAHLELEPVAKALHAPEDAHGVSFAEALVEQLDVVPDPGLDSSARVDELERDVRAARPGAQPPLAGNGVEPFDDAVRGELGNGRDGAHQRESRSENGW